MEMIQNNTSAKNESVDFVLNAHPDKTMSLSDKLEQVNFKFRFNPFKKNKLSNENVVYLPFKKKRNFSTQFLLILIFLILIYLNSGNEHKQYFNRKDATLHASVMPVSSSINNFVSQPESNTAKEKKQKKQVKNEQMEGVKANLSPKTEEFVIPEFPNLKKKSKNQLSEFGQLAENTRNSYIKRFRKLAADEQKKFGIPVGLTLGLAILNSEFGHSFQSREQNNHFSIKCTENSIPMGKGMSGQDVTEGICYTSYTNAWSSFRANSNHLIQNFPHAFDSKSTEKIITKLNQSGYFDNKTFTAVMLRNVIKMYNLE